MNIKKNMLKGSVAGTCMGILAFAADRYIAKRKTALSERLEAARAEGYLEGRDAVREEIARKTIRVQKEASEKDIVSDTVETTDINQFRIRLILDYVGSHWRQGITGISPSRYGCVYGQRADGSEYARLHLPEYPGTLIDIRPWEVNGNDGTIRYKMTIKGGAVSYLSIEEVRKAVMGNAIFDPRFDLQVPGTELDHVSSPATDDLKEQRCIRLIMDRVGSGPQARGRESITPSRYGCRHYTKSNGNKYADIHIPEYPGRVIVCQATPVPDVDFLWDYKMSSDQGLATIAPSAEELLEALKTSRLFEPGFDPRVRLNEEVADEKEEAIQNIMNIAGLDAKIVHDHRAADQFLENRPNAFTYASVGFEAQGIVDIWFRIPEYPGITIKCQAHPRLNAPGKYNYFIWQTDKENFDLNPFEILRLLRVTEAYRENIGLLNR